MRALLAALALCACAKSAFSNAPYPCPKDGVCSPDGDPTSQGTGLACIAGQCEKYQFCTVSRPGDSTSCSSGRCTVMLTEQTNLRGVCVPNSGTGAPGAACSMTVAPDDPAIARYPTAAPDSCAAGEVCATPLWDPALTPACRSFCTLDSQCGAGEACFEIQSSTGINEGICFPQCDIFSTTSCPSGQACTLVPGSPNVAGFCVTPGTAKEGDLCQLVPFNDITLGNKPVLCQPGLQCMNENGGTFRCRHPCTSGNTACPSGESCTVGQGCNGVCACR